MTPIHLENMNLRLSPPQTMPDGTTCEPLMAYKLPDRIITAWKLSDEDLDNLLATGVLFLQVMGQGHPPVFIYTQAETIPAEVKPKE